ncbi:YopX family protein [Bacillus subtilis]|uniref:YopX family protein n=1 Tax=Bacillus subtilis TaxID=1423 RepID=A0AAQ3ET80_BACIU|nr:YopX family protein [Bacillus subtilis]WHM19863.1 YopX family protein [Bacillus subtilis]WHM22404.1 YopX family protein [Bacillus subtilis]
MREIKFRFWDIVWKKMLTHGDLWDAPFNELFISTPDQRPYNIMQYTGLKDKNGREIYEGDILQISNKENKDYHMEVLWTGQGFGYRIIRNETKRSGYIVGHHSERGLNFYNGASEVIGNIYEDPELLEGAE